MALLYFRPPVPTKIPSREVQEANTHVKEGTRKANNETIHTRKAPALASTMIKQLKIGQLAR